MDFESDRRREQRLKYHWPVWFAEDFNGFLSQGQMVDISSGGAAFTCYDDEQCPFPEQQMTMRFSVPKFAEDDSFEMASFTRQARIARVDKVNNCLQRVAIQFLQPLPFKPGEQAPSEEESNQRLKHVMI